MSYASTYFRAFSFTNFQTANPSEPPPGINLDSEFNKISNSINGILANQKLLQRTDGLLANQAVGYDQLSAAINLSLRGVTLWATATSYTQTVGSTPSALVSQNNNIYYCAISHTSGTFATDLAAGKWVLLAGATNSVLQSFIQATTTALARAAIGSTTVGDAVFIAASTLAARTALGVGNTGNNVFTAATNATARAAIAMANANIASARNLVIKQASNTTATVTADEIVSKVTKGGDAYEDSSVNYTLNFATTGVNGLDTGAIGASSFYYVYSIFNPTSSTKGVLASLSATAPTLPSGYTSSALIGVLLTDGSSHLLVSYQFGREVFWDVPISILSNLSPLVAGLTSQSIAAAVPPNIAKSVSGYLTLNPVSAVTNHLQVAATFNGAGLQEGPQILSSTVSNETTNTLNFRKLPLVFSQNLYKAYGNTSTGTTNSLAITSFEF